MRPIHRRSKLPLHTHRAACWEGMAATNCGVGHRFGHRLKPVSDMRNPLKRVERVSSALKRTLAISRRFESAGLAGTMTIAPNNCKYGEFKIDRLQGRKWVHTNLDAPVGLYCPVQPLRCCAFSTKTACIPLDAVLSNLLVCHASGGLIKKLWWWGCSSELGG